MTSINFVPPEVVQGTTTSWLPLTTAYPSLPGCADAFFLFPGQPAPVGWDPGYGYFAGATLSCLPGPQTTWWEQGHQKPDGYTRLSIQPIVCPAAFTTAATETRSGSSTLVKCCPSEYSLAGGQPGRIVGGCSSSLSSGQILTYTAQAANGTWYPQTLTITTASSIEGIPVEGWNVAGAVSLASTTAPMPTTTSTEQSHESEGLSTGAKAGIGVGVAVVFLGLFLLAFVMLRRHRKKQRKPLQMTMSAPHEAETSAVHEMYHSSANETRSFQRPAELESRQGLIPGKGQ